MGFVKRPNVKSILRYKKELIFFIVTYGILFISAFHNRYPDEMDNILGGYFINHGRLPYKGFFTHHGPLAYYLASFLTLFSGQSFVKFRIASTLFYVMLLLGSYILFRKRARTVNPNFYLVFISIFVVSSTYFWAHMFLADPLSGYLFIPAYGILLIKMYKKEVLLKIDLFVISIFSSLGVINSPTYVYAVFILAVFSFVHYIGMQKKQKYLVLFKKLGILALIFIAPYAAFLIFLSITSSVYDYYFQALVYNKNYYIYNYPKPVGSPTLNPVRYAVIIFNNFFNSYQVLLSAIKNVDFINPFNITLALSNFVLWVILFMKKNYSLLLLTLLMTIYVNVRSNPLNVKATDYQAAVYIMLTFFNSSFLFFILEHEIQSLRLHILKVLLTSFSVLFIVFWFFSCLFIFGELWRISYMRYMGKLPLIYDRPQVAPIINQLVASERYCWVGPFDFEELLYLSCKIPSRFHIIRHFFDKIDPFRNEMLSDFERNKPDVIVYKRKIFGESTIPEDRFFTKFLDGNYVRIKDINQGKYTFKNSKTQDFLLNEDFNFEKSKAEKFIGVLIERGYVEEKGS